MSLVDSHGRRINYLRLSVTDRCNLCCTYCTPATGVTKMACAEVLSYEELLQLSRAALAIGIEKIRVTGGEPLVRKDLPAFLTELARLPGLRQLVLTTNGILLAQKAGELKRAGVQRLNISLDSLRPATFARISRGGDLAAVLEGIAAAERAELPVKLNMVVMRGINDDELVDFAALTLHKGVTVRFIEHMPAAQAVDSHRLLLPGSTILSRLAESFPLEPLSRGELSGPAQEFRISGAAGTIGLITPLSGHFCGECNRIRVDSSGRARSCLFGSPGADLKPLLAAGGLPLEAALRRLVEEKPARHLLNEASASVVPFTMAAIGG